MLIKTTITVFVVVKLLKILRIFSGQQRRNLQNKYSKKTNLNFYAN